MTRDPDAALAEQAKSDPKRFAELFDLYHPRVFTYLLYRTGDDASADELAAQVFESLLTGLARYRPERDILGLKFAGGFTNRAIARLMGLGESHVGVLIYRALRKMRDVLEPDDG